MARHSNAFVRSLYQDWQSSAQGAWRALRQRGPSQFQFWLIALVIGICAGAAALFFRKSINALQAWAYGAEDVDYIHSFAAGLPWYMLLIIPTCGGLVVGLVLHYFTPDARVRSVADVIEGAALNNGRVERRAGLASAVASLITLSTGGSSGREGPVVHLAGVISTWVSNWIRADGITGRDLLGCAVAGAVSASFNAPIAGALFALEVVLRHFAVHAFAPIVIASVAGTVINRLEFGNVAEFDLVTPGELQFYAELPAFLLLGGVCGLVAVVLMRSVFFTEKMMNTVQERSGLPRWLRPTVSGALLGFIAIWFPHIIGVGYETTALALMGQLTVQQCILFVAIKTAAASITIGGRMGGGIFSPALMIGAITGLAFGWVATSILPEVSGLHTLYAFAGMGAVAAAVLGAPISTTLIVFELTGDWQIGLAVMVAISVSTAFASQVVDRSFFLTQLENRGIHCAAGPQDYLLSLQNCGGLMRPLGDGRGPSEVLCRTLMADGIVLSATATLDSAMPIFEREPDLEYIPIVEAGAGGTPELLGALFHIDALKAYNTALAAAAAEEHS